MRLGKNDAVNEGRASQHNRGNTPRGGVLGKTRAGDIFFDLSETVGNLVFMAKVDETLEFTEISRRKQDSLARGDAFARFRHERGNIAVITCRGLRLHGARLDTLPGYGELIEFQTCVARELPIPIAGKKMGGNHVIRGTG